MAKSQAQEPDRKLRTASATLSVAEKRSRLARIVRADLLDCLDDSGAFDHARARQLLAGGTVQKLFVDEVERTDRHGNTTVRRKIRVYLVDKIRAMKCDEALAPTAELENALEEKTRRVEWLEASVAQAKERDKDIEKEVSTRCWRAIQDCLRDNKGMPLPGIPHATFEAIVDKATARHPRPP
jgi:hypothetical protein